MPARNSIRSPGSNPDSPLYNIVSGNLAVTDTVATTITNYGKIVGDILVLDTNPLVTAAAGSQTSAPNGFFLATPYAVSASNSGPRDSDIFNGGTIDGNIYLGSGDHTIDNEGAMVGNINVDQRDSQGSFAVGKPGTLPGTIEHWCQWLPQLRQQHD